MRFGFAEGPPPSSSAPHRSPHSAGSRAFSYSIPAAQIPRLSIGAVHETNSTSASYTATLRYEADCRTVHLRSSLLSPLPSGPKCSIGWLYPAWKEDACEVHRPTPLPYQCCRAHSRSTGEHTRGTEPTHTSYGHFAYLRSIVPCVGPADGASCSHLARYHACSPAHHIAQTATPLQHPMPHVLVGVALH